MSIERTQFDREFQLNWSLEPEVLFDIFPEICFEDLLSNAYRSNGTTYLNVTRFNECSQSHITTLETGYTIAFIALPDELENYSWFFIDKRPDFLLGRIDSFNGIEIKLWEYPARFGGLNRTIYFDITSITRQDYTSSLLTEIVLDHIHASLSDMFPSLLGAEVSDYMEADTQRYESYNIDILVLSEDCATLGFDKIETSFEDLMPWTTWTVDVKSEYMEAQLQEIISNKTVSLTDPLAYWWQSPDGSVGNSTCNFDVQWTWTKNDPLNSFLIDRLQDYFGIANLDDKSKIPVVLLVMPEDVAFAGTAGIGAGVCLFSSGIVVMGVHRSLVDTMGVCGQLFAENLLRHEIGHWLSISHHSSGLHEYPKMLCSMRALCSKFCDFCRDARFRMSYMSYLNYTMSILAESQTSQDILDDIEESKSCFYLWEYKTAITILLDVLNRIEVQALQTQTLMIQIGVIVTGVTVVVAVSYLERTKRVRKTSNTSNQQPLDFSHI
jgi:hypothetical protein